MKRVLMLMGAAIVLSAYSAQAEQQEVSRARQINAFVNELSMQRVDELETALRRHAHPYVPGTDLCEGVGVEYAAYDHNLSRAGITVIVCNGFNNANFVTATHVLNFCSPEQLSECIVVPEDETQ